MELLVILTKKQAQISMTMEQSKLHLILQVPKNVVDYNNDNCYCTGNHDTNAWICFDFKDMSVCPIKYALKSRHDFGRGSDHLKSWVVEGSNDKSRWTVLDERVDSEALNGAGYESVFKMNMKIDKTKYYRYLRVKATGPMVSGYNNMTVASIEFYGSLIGC